MFGSAPINTVSILLITTYFGRWPVWFPAFLLSCAKNETIDWLIFTDCEIPDIPYENIRFERMTLAQLNKLASQKLGFAVEKEAYSQVDLRPAYGVIFEEHLGGYDFWGHCDIDVIWGNLRNFVSDNILDTYDIVSFRKEFLAGHLTLWRNQTSTNRLFLTVPAHRDILADRGFFGFDEDIISTHIKANGLQDKGNSRVYWPETAIAWFRSGNTPNGWYWDRGRIFDHQGTERVYLHFQHWKRHIKHIDFGIDSTPHRFLFTKDGIWSRKSQSIVGKTRRALERELKQLPDTIAARSKSGLRVAKRFGSVSDTDWARKLAANSIPTTDVRYDRRTGTLFLTRMGLRIDPQLSFVLDNYQDALQLTLHAGASFHATGDGELSVRINELNLRVQSVEDLSTLRQVFVDKIYNILQPDPVVILDVAMNAGFSSLYLASKPNVMVVGCEPCRGPFQRALNNISANPQIGDQVTPLNVGVGPFSCRTIAGYLLKHSRESLGTKANPLGPPFEYEEIEVVDIVDMIDRVSKIHPDRALVLKIETDNADYYVNGLNENNLLRRLVIQGKLHRVHGLLMMWHIRGKSVEIPRITSHLTDAGFTVFRIAPYYARGGMLYATRGTRR